jgi:hypothetical protein
VPPRSPAPAAATLPGPEATRLSVPAVPSSAAAPAAAGVAAGDEVPVTNVAIEVTPPAPVAPTPAATPAAIAVAVIEATAALPTPAAVLERRIVVQVGDDLTHIVRRNYGYADDELLARVQRANPQIVNRDLLILGQEILLPPDEPIEPEGPAGVEAIAP